MAKFREVKSGPAVTVLGDQAGCASHLLGHSEARREQLGRDLGNWVQGRRMQQAPDPQCGGALANTHATIQLSVHAPQGWHCSTCAWDFLPPQLILYLSPTFQPHVVLLCCSMPCTCVPSPQNACLPSSAQGAPFQHPAQRGLCGNPSECACCSTPVAPPQLLV